MLPEEPALDIPVPRPSASLARTIRWTTLDQALSSITNFGVTVVAARELSQRDFGAFGLAFSLSVVVMGVARALSTEPLLSRPELADGERQRPAFQAVTATALGLGVLPLLPLVIVGAVVGDVLGRSLVALAFILPGMCLQDAWRYCFVAQGRLPAAAANDAVWLLMQLAALTALSASGVLSAPTILLAWGCSGTAAAVVGALQARALPQASAGWAWLRDQRSLGGRYLLEFVTSTAGAQLALMGLGATAGLVALGAVRGAQTFFGPLVVLFNGLFFAVVPIGTRFRTSQPRLRRLMLGVSAAMCACSLAWTLVGVALPDGVGRQLFGVTWAATHSVLGAMGLAFVAGAVGSGAIAGLRSLAAAREGLRARLLSAPFLVLGPLLGGVVAQAPGFAFGLAASSMVAAALYWRHFLLAGRREASSSGLSAEQSQVD